MTRKKLTSNIYHIEKIMYEPKKGFYYYEDPNGYLFSNFKYRTKIKPEDLPDYYVYGRFYKRWGFLCSEGVKGVYYKPLLWINHFLRDDLLFISYKNEQIDEIDVEDFGYKTFDYFISGNEILDFLKAMTVYSPSVNIEPIKDGIKNKLKVLKEKYPDEFGDYEFDVDKFFKEPYEKKNYKMY